MHISGMNFFEYMPGPFPALGECVKAAIFSARWGYLPLNGTCSGISVAVENTRLITYWVRFVIMGYDLR
jgi:hypothetical protein